MSDHDLPSQPAVPTGRLGSSVADTIVVGGGVIGLMTALELRATGQSVVVLEAQQTGSAQSGRNLGFVRQQGRGPSEAVLMRRSTELWKALHDRLGSRLGWTRGGHASIGRDADTEEEVRSWAPIAREHGIPFEIVDADEVRQRFPWLGAGIRVLGFTPGDGHLDPAVAMEALRALALAEGVELLEQTSALSLDVEAGRVVGVHTPGGTIRAAATVLAAGMWSSRLLRPHGVLLPQYTGIGTIARTVPVHSLTQSSVWDLTGLGMRQDTAGRINFGLGQYVDIDLAWEEVAASPRLLPTYLKNRRSMHIRAGHRLLGDVSAMLRRQPLPALPLTHPSPNPEWVEKARRELHRLIPSIDPSVGIETAWAGTIDSTADFLPVIGEIGLDGLVVATGMSGHGMGIAPAVAEAVSQIIHDGAATVADISALRPQRLAGFRPYQGRGNR